MFGQVEGDVAVAVPGEPGGYADQVPPQGGAASTCVEGRAQGPGGARQVIGDRGDRPFDLRVLLEVIERCTPARRQVFSTSGFRGYLVT